MLSWGSPMVEFVAWFERGKSSSGQDEEEGGELEGGDDGFGEVTSLVFGFRE